jgi:hypothetical protein
MGSAVGKLVGAGASLLGSKMSSDAAKAGGAGIMQSAKDLRKMARLAAEETRFRPVAVTTGFGGSNFQFDDKGRLTGAGYELTPEMLAMRDQLIGQAGQQGMGFTEQGLGAAQGMFDLGQGYLAQSPEAAAQQWMQTQQEALAPQRQQAMSGLMNRLAQTGTQGLGVAQAGGGQANPLMQAFANAQAQQDLNLAAQAQEQGRAQTQFGTGLLSDAFRTAVGGYAPLNTQLQQAQGIEGLGQQAYNMGVDLGVKQSEAGGRAANFLMQGATGSANLMSGMPQQNSWMGDALMGLGGNTNFTGALGGLFGGGYSNPWSGGSLSTWSSPGGITAGSQQDRMLRAQVFG